MRGISEERIKQIISSHALTIKTGNFLEYLITDECHELQEPWTPLDEFLKSGFTGLCWVPFAGGVVESSYFDGKEFRYIVTSKLFYPRSRISRVSPIHKQEPPR